MSYFMSTNRKNYELLIMSYELGVTSFTFLVEEYITIYIQSTFRGFEFFLLKLISNCI